MAYIPFGPTETIRGAILFRKVRLQRQRRHAARLPGPEGDRGQ